MNKKANVESFLQSSNIAQAACAAARDLGKPYGVAFRLEPDGKLKSGESLAEAVSAISQYAPDSVMLNCCDPEVITAAMPELIRLHPCVGGYANAFRSVEAMASGGLADELEARADMSPQAYLSHVRRWLTEGARVVGGCCEITPDHIRYISESLAGDYEFIRFSQLSEPGIAPPPTT